MQGFDGPDIGIIYSEKLYTRYGLTIIVDSMIGACNIICMVWQSEISVIFWEP